MSGGERAALPVTVVVVTYQSRATVEVALSSLKRAHDQAGVRCIVVDNASTDGTLEQVAARHPWVRAISSGGNLGFGRANNLALPLVTTDYVLFLNPDASIELEELARMVEFMDSRPSAALVAPAIAEAGRAVQMTYPFPSPGLYLRDAAGRKATYSTSRLIELGGAPERVDWVSGAVLLGRVSVLNRLGGFDPRFFLYFEETDLCLRARALGHETWALGSAVAMHVAGSSARQGRPAMFRGCIAEHYFRSRLYYLSKHYGLLPALATDLLEYLLLLSGAIGRKLTGRPVGSDTSRRLRSPLFRMPARPPAPPRPNGPAPRAHPARAGT